MVPSGNVEGCRLPYFPLIGPLLVTTISIGSITGESPPDQRVGMTMAHAVFGLKEIDNLHVLLFAASHDDLLPLGD